MQEHPARPLPLPEVVRLVRQRRYAESGLECVRMGLGGKEVADVLRALTLGEMCREVEGEGWLWVGDGGLGKGAEDDGRKRSSMREEEHGRQESQGQAVRPPSSEPSGLLPPKCEYTAHDPADLSLQSSPPSLQRQNAPADRPLSAPTRALEPSSPHTDPIPSSSHLASDHSRSIPSRQRQAQHAHPGPSKACPPALSSLLHSLRHAFLSSCPPKMRKPWKLHNIFGENPAIISTFPETLPGRTRLGGLTSVLFPGVGGDALGERLYNGCEVGEMWGGQAREAREEGEREEPARANGREPQPGHAGGGEEGVSLSLVVSAPPLLFLPESKEQGEEEGEMAGNSEESAGMATLSAPCKSGSSQLGHLAQASPALRIDDSQVCTYGTYSRDDEQGYGHRQHLRQRQEDEHASLQPAPSNAHPAAPPSHLPQDASLPPIPQHMHSQSVQQAPEHLPRQPQAHAATPPHPSQSHLQWPSSRQMPSVSQLTIPEHLSDYRSPLHPQVPTQDKAQAPESESMHQQHEQRQQNQQQDQQQLPSLLRNDSITQQTASPPRTASPSIPSTIPPLPLSAPTLGTLSTSSIPPTPPLNHDHHNPDALRPSHAPLSSPRSPNPSPQTQPTLGFPPYTSSPYCNNSSTRPSSSSGPHPSAVPSFSSSPPPLPPNSPSYTNSISPSSSPIHLQHEKRAFPSQAPPLPRKAHPPLHIAHRPPVPNHHPHLAPPIPQMPLSPPPMPSSHLPFPSPPPLPPPPHFTVPPPTQVFTYPAPPSFVLQSPLSHTRPFTPLQPSSPSQPPPIPSAPPYILSPNATPQPHMSPYNPQSSNTLSFPSTLLPFPPLPPFSPLPHVFPLMQQWGDRGGGQRPETWEEEGGITGEEKERRMWL